MADQQAFGITDSDECNVGERRFVLGLFVFLFGFYKKVCFTLQIRAGGV